MAFRESNIQIDKEDHEKVSQYKWYIVRSGNKFYAMRNVRIKKGKWTTEYLHRFLLKAEKGQIIDHVNGNGLDNIRKNLRFCSHAENIRNQVCTSKKTSSKYKGVSFHKDAGKWQAEIQVDYQKKYLGVFSKEKDAALKYNELAKVYFGEFANLNSV